MPILISNKQFNRPFSGSFIGDFTGSLLGTALTASHAISALSALSAITSLTTISASHAVNSKYAITASYLDSYIPPFPFTGSAVITGSLTVYGSLNATSSNAILSQTSLTTILNNTLVTNQTVGGLPAGSSINAGSSLETILRSILITYIPPTLSSLNVRIGNFNISTAARDVGNFFEINSASFSATPDNPTNLFPLSASFTGSGADIGTFFNFFGNNVLTGSNILSLGNIYTINRTGSAGSVTFTVNGRRSDTNALISPTTVSISFLYRNYICASSTIPIDNVSVQSILNFQTVQSVLASSRGWTATCTSANDVLGNYTYIIYPSSYGTLSNIIQNGALSVLSAFTNLGVFTVVNDYGCTLTVRVYKSNSDKAFSSGTTLAIS